MGIATCSDTVGYTTDLVIPDDIFWDIRKTLFDIFWALDYELHMSKLRRKIKALIYKCLVCVMMVHFIFRLMDHRHLGRKHRRE